MATPLRVLLVEDSEDDALLLERHLRQGDYDPYLLRVDTGPALDEALGRQPWDVIICDYSLPHFSGIEALHHYLAYGLDVPFIIVSGTIGEETAVAAMKAGAHDYLKKDNLARLIPAIERELREADERRARRRAEEALRNAEVEKKAFYREVVSAVTGGRLLLHDRGDLDLSCADAPTEVRNPADIRRARLQVRALAEAAGLAPQRTDDLELAVGEALANAWKHAGGGLVWTCIADDALRVTISDSGSGIAPSQLARAAFEKGYSTAHTLGAGFTLMLGLVDRLHLVTDPAGTTVALDVSLHGPAPADPWDTWAAPPIGTSLA